PLRRTIRYLAGDLQSHRPQRLSQADLQQAHRRDRSRSCQLLERALRPQRDYPARLEDARPEARRQTAFLRRRIRYLVPRPRRPPLARLPRDHHRSVLPGHIRFWRTPTALLYRCCRLLWPRWLDGVATLPARHGEAHGADRAQGCGSEQLEILGSAGVSPANNENMERRAACSKTQTG